MLPRRRSDGMRAAVALALSLLHFTAGALAGHDSASHASRRECGNSYTEERVETLPGEFDVRRPFVPAYECPLGGGDPAHTQCCEPATFECCRQRRFWEMDWRVASSVVLLCLVAVCAVAAACFGCCFCHQSCPLYGRSLCVKQAKPDYIAQPYETASYMPGEAQPGVRVYEFNRPHSDDKTDLV